MLHDRSLADVLAAFAAPSSTPAVGSAAALNGALGASLLAMIAGMPRMREDSPAEARTALDAARAALLGHQQTLLALVDRDAAAYDAVLAAGDDAPTRQQALTAATEVLVDIVKTCTAALHDARPVGEFGDPATLTDLVGGVNGLATGVQSAWLTAVANLDALEDSSAVDRLLADIKADMGAGYRELPLMYKTSGVVQLMMRAAERTGLPHGAPRDPKDRRTMLGRGVAMSLRRLATPEAKAALEVLAGSQDAAVAGPSAEALAEWDVPPEPGV